MNKPSGLLGDTLGQLGSLGKGLGQSIVSTPKDLAKTAAAQVGVAALEEQEKVGLGDQLTGGEKKSKNESGFSSDKDRTDFLQGLYGLNSKEPQNSQSSQQAQKSSEMPKSPQEQQKLMDAQQQLAALKQSQHKSEYYDPTFNRPEPQEERAAEKVEKEKEEDERKNLQEKKKKEEKPMSVQMGEQRAEKFRGAAG